MSGSGDSFNFRRLQTHLDSCLVGENDINLVKYVDVFAELHSFCSTLGSVFGFVATEISSKLEIIKGHLEREKDNFSTLKKMISHERNSNLLYKSGYVSCSRTILILNRGLDFIRCFLDNVGSLDKDEGTVSAAHKSYNETLAKHHSFFIRQGAYLAMYILPSRDRLLEQVSTDVEADITILPEVVELARQVFQRTYSCYEREGLTGLP